MNNCELWLTTLLPGQTFMNCEEIRIRANAAGFSKGQLSAARKSLGVTVINDSSLHDGKAENWFWLIPKEAGELDA